MQYNEKELERILRSFPVMKAAAVIEAQRLYNLFPSCIGDYSGMPHSPNAADSTGKIAVARTYLSPTMRRVMAIEAAFDALDKLEKDLIRLVYYEKWRIYDVLHQMNISRSHFFRLKVSALGKIAGLLIRPDLPVQNIEKDENGTSVGLIPENMR